MAESIPAGGSTFDSIQSLILMPEGRARELVHMFDVRDYDAPGGGSAINIWQRQVRFFFFKYLVAPFFRTTWQRQVEFNRRVAAMAQAFSAMEARIHELEEKLRGATPAK